MDEIIPCVLFKGKRIGLHCLSERNTWVNEQSNLAENFLSSDCNFIVIILYFIIYYYDDII